jgi:hypothetical protein
MKKPDVFLFFLAVAGITFIALILRVWAVRKLPVDQDENVYLKAGSLYAQAIQQNSWIDLARISYNNEHPSFVKLFYGVILSRQKLTTVTKAAMPTYFIVPNGIIKGMLMTARNVSMVFGVLAVTVLAVFNPVAGFFLAVHSFAIKYTSVAYLEAIPSLTSLLAVLAYLRWITLVDRQPKPLAFANNLSIHFWLVLSGMAFGITLASKFEYSLIGTTIVVHYAWKTIREGYPLKKAILFMAGYGLVAAFFFFAGDIYLWSDPVHRLLGSIQFHFQYQDRPKVKSAYPVWQIFYWFSKSASQQDPLAIPHLGNSFLLSLDLPISILAIIGLPRLFKKNLFFFLWLVLSLAFLLVWSAKWPQYTMLVVTPLCLSASEGFHMIVIDPLVRLINRFTLKTKALERKL